LTCGLCHGYGNQSLGMVHGVAHALRSRSDHGLEINAGFSFEGAMLGPRMPGCGEHYL
jgi:hypothetical protein